MGALNYLKTMLSLRKLTYRYVSSLAERDCRSSFTKKSGLRYCAKLFNVQMGYYSSVGIDSKVAKAEVIIPSPLATDNEQNKKASLLQFSTKAKRWETNSQ